MTPTDAETLCDLAMPLLERGIALHTKAQVAELLPFLITCSTAAAREQLSKHIRNIIVYDFPLSSRDVEPGMGTYVDYVTMVDLLFQAVEDSGNLEYLHMVLPMLREKTHIRKARMDESLIAFVQNSREEVSELVARSSAYHNNIAIDSKNIDYASHICIYNVMYVWVCA
tara:strand:+ start:102 stop:611 length:510 start_codon:yes stop_codon:yes gene_type:complete